MLSRIFNHVSEMAAYCLALFIKAILIVGCLWLGCGCLGSCYIYYGFVRPGSGTMLNDFKFGALGIIGAICVVITIVTTIKLDDN